MKMLPKPRDLETSTVGEFITERRKAAGCSLRAFARKIKVSPSFLSEVERNKRYPSDAVQRRIADALGFDVAELKRFDRRVPLDELRRMIEKSPEFSSVLLLMIDQVKSGQKGLKALAEQIRAAIEKPGTH
jgi:transcriptional regulator with XRE-family HTH domain